MSKSSDCLHFDGVSFIEWVIKNTGSIDDLPFSIFVIGVTDEQTLSGESIRLNINVCVRHIVNQTRFTNVWETSQDQRPGIGIDCWKSTQMLSDFFQIAEGTLQLLKECSLSTKCRSFKQFASVKRISVLHQSNVIGSNVIYNILSFVDVTQGQLVMISIVKNIHQISVERMNIIKFWERIDDSLKSFIYT